MSIHIARFVDKLRAAESRQARDVILSVIEARDLHNDITKLLLALEELRTQPSAQAPDIVNIEVEGGRF